MKNSLAPFLLAAIAGTAGAADEPAAAKTAAFELTSPDIAQGRRISEAQVFNGFGCAGQNVSPALAWKNAPAGTRSYAVMVHDPDAPTGSGWWHWIVYNIPASTMSLPANAGRPDSSSLPPGAAQGVTDFGSPGYGGPCPPPGKPHRYFFRLHALKIDRLEVPPGASAAFIGVQVNANTLAKTQIMAVYGR
jgi:Raf kinase inhibitor-like YbhB/YbcL family protein